VVDKICEAAHNPRNHRYSASRGLPNLRSAISEWYLRRHGVAIDPDREAIATIGSKEGYAHFVLMTIGPGDVVLCPDPAYPIHQYAVIIAGGDLRTVPLTPDTDFVESLKAVMERTWPKPKLLILSFPANPTGQVVDRAFFERVIEFARENDLMVIHDFAYAEVCFDGYRAPSILEVPGARDVAIEFGSLSKSHSMAGWRVGFAAGNAEMIHALGASRAISTTACPLPSRWARSSRCAGRRSVSPKRCGPTAIAATRWSMDSVRRAKAVEDREAARHDVRLGADPEPLRQLGSLEFAKRLMTEAKVAVSPGLGFGEAGEGFVRFALVENRHRIRQAVRGIRHFLREAGV